MIQILYEYKVIEHYEDKNTCPEDFGYVYLKTHPKVGDIIPLHWLDGRLYANAKALSVSIDKAEVHVEVIKDDRSGSAKEASDQTIELGAVC